VSLPFTVVVATGEVGITSRSIERRCRPQTSCSTTRDQVTNGGSRWRHVDTLEVRWLQLQPPRCMNDENSHTAKVAAPWLRCGGYRTARTQLRAGAYVDKVGPLPWQGLKHGAHSGLNIIPFRATGVGCGHVALCRCLPLNVLKRIDSQ